MFYFSRFLNFVLIRNFITTFLIILFFMLDPPPPYTPGYYNPATGQPYNELTDNCLNNQAPVIQRQRAVATVNISPSCPPYPMPSPPYLTSSNTPSTRHSTLVRRSNNYEDELSGAMGATKISD